MKRKYSGKYPERVHTVFSACVDGKHIMRLRLNDGRVFDISPKGPAAPMPNVGDDFSTVLATSNAVPFASTIRGKVSARNNDKRGKTVKVLSDDSTDIS